MVQGKRDRIGGEDVDMLLKLPKEILTKILSSLPTKDAFRTSILSKKWENKWLSIYNIDMNDQMSLSHVDQFVNIVDKLLTHHVDNRNSSALQKLKFRFSKSYLRTRFITWISAALRRNVQILDLRILNINQFSLPESIYRQNSSLEEMRTRMPIIIYHHPSFGFFANLKVLELCKAIFNHQNIADETLSFPVLEHMSLNECKWINFCCVKIDAPSLVHFRLANCTFKQLAPTEKYERRLDGCIFKVMSSKLERFMYYGGEYTERFFLPQPSLVSDATYNLSFYGSLKVSYATGTIAQFLQVKHLELTIEVILVNLQEMLDEMPTLKMVNTLKVSSNENREMDGPSLLWFLQKTPNVHTLILEMNCSNSEAKRLGYVPAVPPCMQYSARKLKLVYSNKYDWGGKDLFLIKYLVKNAAATLEEIEIYAPNNKSVAKTTLKAMMQRLITLFPFLNDVFVNII